MCYRKSQYHANHVYYRESHQGGSAGYEVVPAPTGVKMINLPPEAATVAISGTTFYYYKNTFCRRAGQDYVVVRMPVGVTVVEALPAEFEILQAPNGNAYIVYQGTHYLPHVRTTGDRSLYRANRSRPCSSEGSFLPGTVKLYTVKIYQKLDVHSRREAVAEAGELGLLSRK